MTFLLDVLFYPLLFVAALFVELFGRKKRDYHEYLRSTVWKKKRQRVLKRDRHRCTRCGSTKNLQVHHLTYDRIFRERLSDLTTLCAKCHMREHGLTKKRK